MILYHRISFILWLNYELLLFIPTILLLLLLSLIMYIINAITSVKNIVTVYFKDDVHFIFVFEIYFCWLINGLNSDV